MSWLKYNIFLMLMYSFAYAQQGITFESANIAYKNEQYNDAITQYETLIKEKFHSANLYYNLGNAYYKNDQLGKSILFLEKAQKLAPRNKDIQHNLSFAYAKTVDNIEPLPRLFFVNWWFSLLNFYSASTWAIFGVVLLWTSLLIWGINLLLKKRNIKVVGAILLLVSFINLFIAYQKNNYDKSSSSAIILQESAHIKNTPKDNAENTNTIHEGLKVSIKDSVDTWYKIKLQDGTEGWVQKDVLGVI